MAEVETSPIHVKRFLLALKDNALMNHNKLTFRVPKFKYLKFCHLEFSRNVPMGIG
jgi:hypothetical protein